MLNDLILFNQIKRGNIKSFEQIFRKYYMPLYYYSFSIVKDSDNAEEIVQELFYTIWKKREDIAIQQSFKSYLYRSVLNQSFRYLRHYSIREKYRNDQINNPIVSHTPLDEIEYNELEETIFLIINKLPERRRKIFLMHRQEQLKYKDIAEQLSLSVKTIEAEMTKAYKQLRQEIEKYIHDYEIIKK